MKHVCTRDTWWMENTFEQGVVYDLDVDPLEIGPEDKPINEWFEPLEKTETLTLRPQTDGGGGETEASSKGESKPDEKGPAKKGK